MYDQVGKSIMMTETDWETICRSPLFSGLPRDALEALLTGASVETATAQTILFLLGDDADRFYAVLNGWVKLSRAGAEGEETVMNVVAAGETLTRLGNTWAEIRGVKID